MYLEYCEYKDMGGTLDGTAFIRLESKARKLVDTRTFGRLIGLTTRPKVVEMLMFELIALLDLEEAPIVTGVSNDGYSESYQAKTPTLNTFDLIYQYLINEILEDGTPLLYRGCD